MDLPGTQTAQAALATLAAFVRDRLAEVAALRQAQRPDQRPPGAAARVPLVVVAPAAPFATTSYARARLLRQLHGAGLITAVEAERAAAGLRDVC